MEKIASSCLFAWLVFAAMPAAAQAVVTQVSAGHAHACALTREGGVKCWGANASGQLGDGTLIERFEAVDVIGLRSGVASVSAGDSGTCALMVSGGVWCWGEQLLADGSKVPNPAPRAIAGLANITQVVPNCAVNDRGEILCWEFTTLETGSGYPVSFTTRRHIPPERIGSLANVRALSVSGSCAITLSNDLYCGNDLESLAYAASGYTAVAAGAYRRCAISLERTVTCWNPPAIESGRPYAVPGLEGGGVVAIDGASNSVCALLADGIVKCWGGNSSGQLGDGTSTGRGNAAAVIGLPGPATAVSVADNYACAVVSGSAWCWGSGYSRLPRGVTGLSAGTATNVDGLWWGSPAGSESGWGINVVQQGGLLFATWFTYGADGRGIWLVMPRGVSTGAGKYAGPLYRTRGPAFNAATWDPALVVATPVGSAAFEFSADADGIFTAVVDGVPVSKPITREVFGPRLPVCRETGPVGALPRFQGLWWRSPAGSESGWGVNIVHQGYNIFATWFTYDAQGNAQWLVMPDGINCASFGYSGVVYGTLYRTSGPAYNASPWNPADVKVTKVGTAAFFFTDTDTGSFQYTLDGVTQTKPLTREVFASPTTACR